MRARDLSIRFAEAFCQSDLSGLEALLAPDLRFRGPLFRFDSRADYVRSLAEAPPEPGTCNVLQVHGDEHSAAILYEYGRSTGDLLVAQFNRVADTLLSEIRLVFDSAAVPRPT